MRLGREGEGAGGTGGSLAVPTRNRCGLGAGRPPVAASLGGRWRWRSGSGLGAAAGTSPAARGGWKNNFPAAVLCCVGCCGVGVSCCFFLFLFFFNVWHLEMLLPCEQGPLSSSEMQPQPVHVLHRLRCVPALTGCGKPVVSMGCFVRRVRGCGGDLCEQWFLLVEWRLQCCDRGPLSWCQHRVLVRLT